MKLKDKVVVITGAGRGIGAAIAGLFSEQGAVVACVSRSLENAKKTADAIQSRGGQATAYALDVACFSDSEEAMGKILAEFGRVDILVNNAGVTRDGLMMRMSEEDWDAVLDTNLKGAFNCTKPIVRSMIKQRFGRIINISSISGIMGNAGQTNYSASKAGLIGWTKSLALEVASRGITCNAIAPGFIVSDMTDALSEEVKQKVMERIPLSRFGEVKDIAEAALFLAADSGQYITGQVLVVDGGMAI